MVLLQRFVSSSFSVLRSLQHRGIYDDGAFAFVCTGGYYGHPVDDIRVKLLSTNPPPSSSIHKRLFVGTSLAGFR